MLYCSTFDPGSGQATQHVLRAKDKVQKYDRESQTSGSQATGETTNGLVQDRVPENAYCVSYNRGAPT